MAEIRRCAAEGCQVSDGGSCIEGFDDLVNCPNFLEGEQNHGELAISKDEVGGNEKSAGAFELGRPAVSLSSGNALTTTEGHRLTGEYPTKVVILMGMVKSGKTTVLSELYERFCEGPFAGQIFAGSRTVMGFERICFLSRAASLRDSEDTERTMRGTENNLLHLDLVAEGAGPRRRLLLSDLSGEWFEEATESNEKLYGIPYLRRADHVVVFADAEKLGNNLQRQYLLNQLLVLLRCCIEERRIKNTCRLTIVVSRHDLLPAEMDQTFLESMKSRIYRRTGEYFNRPVTFLDLAARPKCGPERAYGLAELLNLWLEEPAATEPHVPKLMNTADEARREIDKFAFKASGNDQ